jgi:hypothetical protein
VIPHDASSQCNIHTSRYTLTMYCRPTVMTGPNKRSKAKSAGGSGKFEVLIVTHWLPPQGTARVYRCECNRLQALPLKPPLIQTRSQVASLQMHCNTLR